MIEKRKDKTPNSKSLIQIIADDRERKSEVIELLAGFEDVDIYTQRLSLGDYQIDNRLIIERKTLKDFAVSIIDGRIFRQMICMANSTSMGVLILEGTINDLKESGVTREAMQGALITVSIVLGIPVLRSRDAYETAKLIVYSSRQVKSTVRGDVFRHGYRPKNKRKRQLFILQGLPGVGPEKAGRLLDTFGSVEAVVSADSSELQTVYGIGSSVADSIRWAVGEQMHLYGTRK